MENPFPKLTEEARKGDKRLQKELSEYLESLARKAHPKLYDFYEVLAEQSQNSEIERK